VVEEVGEEEIRLWGGEDGRNVGKKNLKLMRWKRCGRINL
jgi:hypothetical protein